MIAITSARKRCKDSSIFQLIRNSAKLIITRVNSQINNAIEEEAIFIIMLDKVL